MGPFCLPDRRQCQAGWICGTSPRRPAARIGPRFVLYVRLYTSTRRYGQLDMADFDARPSRCRYLFCRATRGSQPPRTQDKSDRVDRGASTSSGPISVSNAVTTVRSDGPRAPSESSYHQLTGSALLNGNLPRKRSSGRGTLSFHLKRARTDLSLYLRTTLLEWDRQPTN